MTTQLVAVGTKFVGRSFEDRLGDFAPELAAFLRQAWNQRVAAVNGAIDLYDIYTGDAKAVKVSYGELTEFLKQMRQIHPAAAITVQDYPKPRKFTPLSAIGDDEIKIHRHALAGRFYHCLQATGGAFSRIYVHASNVAFGLDILQEVVSYFPRIAGIAEAKIGGPAMIERADTIVIYLQSQAASDELLPKLLELRTRWPGAFSPGVPSLVKEVAPGIGTSNEPPGIEIEPGKGSRHSFGTFYCDLILMALKHTPEVRSINADGRHMLDNLLWSLRMLGIDPKDHLAFPERAKLEAYQQAIAQKPPVVV